jgi:signal transduction histidine kinase
VTLAAKLWSGRGRDPIVVVLGAVMLAVFAMQPDEDLPAGVDGTPMDGQAAVILVLACMALLFRRAAPMTVVTVMLVLQSWWNTIGYTNGAINVATLIAYFTVGATGDRVRQVGSLALAAATLIVAVAVDHHPWWWIISNLGWPLAAVLFGEISRTRRILMENYQERAERAEADREAEAERFAEERLRIARDLHDLLGHTVSLMTVQAGVAAAKVDRAPDQTREAIDHIRVAGRQATHEIQAMVQLMRSAEKPSLAPTPVLSDISTLASNAAHLGFEVNCHIDSDATDLDGLVGLTAYRIVQEALTNVVRHAKARRVTIEVCRDRGMLTCSVRDDGTGTPARPVPGNGLRGMTERVALAGGNLRYGPREDGGFDVVATLPLREEP